jgi:hypothetical protein
MALIPLSSTTLLEFRSRVKGQSSSIVDQFSGVMGNAWDDLIHDAVVFIRSLAGVVLKEQYMTRASVSEVSNLIDIHTYKIADLQGVTLFDETHGSVPIRSTAEFFGLRTLYGSAGNPNGLFAHYISMVDGDIRGFAIETFRGTNKATPGALKFNYPRVPEKPTTDAGYIDLPDYLIPIGIDAATVMAFRRIGRVPPTDIDGRVVAFVNSQVAALGLSVTPEKR